MPGRTSLTRSIRADPAAKPLAAAAFAREVETAGETSRRARDAGARLEALGYHAQPFCLLNVHGFWDGLAGFMDHVVESGFLSEARRLQLLKADTPTQALDLLDEAVKSAAQGVTW